MAAPVAAARVTPLGIMLENSHSTKIAITADPDISFWEVDVTPPGIDGGEPIDVTTMHNTSVRTRAPRALKDFTEGQTTVGYDPNIFNNALAVVNVETTITVHFPDGSTLAFFGYLRTFTPAGMSGDGTFPTATVVFTPTNRDSSGSEQSPVLTSVAGT